ncbi:hypothetical protein N431DRAFT_507314 [Stipitochalara longipes BDJ]|nr:hypothetical protein N431DRAFT_507314 [Stipitochalara longipes BDJ]
MAALKSATVASILMIMTNIASVSSTQNEHHLQTRDPPAIIDFNSFPSCFSPGFLTGCDISDFTGPPVLCDAVPCPDASDDSDPQCIERSCFCGLPYPLRCEWWLCSWGDWYNFEDYFNGICPNALTVDFSGLPDCVRDCLPDQYIIYGCITQGRSCLCQAGETFGCATGCDKASNATISAWFTALCGENEVVAVGDSAAASTTTLPSPSSSHTNIVQRVHPKAAIHWYEAWAIVLICVTAVALILGWILYRVFWRRSRLVLKSKRG